MLGELHISNLAVVKNATLLFGPGLNVITGSTGAGKSLIVGAVNLLLGHRARPEWIRSGCETATVRAVFGPRPARQGSDWNTVEVKREIRTNGRSYAWIDGKPVTVRQLGDLCAGHIEPHAQNEQFRLRDVGSHVAYVDAAASNAAERAAWSVALDEFRAARSRLRAFDTHRLARQEQQELLEHRLDEIGRLAPVPGEREKLERLCALHEAAGKIATALGMATETLYDADGSAHEVVSTARRELAAVSGVDPALEAIAENLEGVEVSLADAAGAMRTYMDSIEFDPEETRRIRDRLDALIGLERRYNLPIDALMERAETWRSELAVCDSSESARSELCARVDETRSVLVDAGTALSHSRRRCAVRLDGRVTDAIGGLGMKGARFRTQLQYQPGEEGDPEVAGAVIAPQADGFDIVRFLLQANPGQDEGPVERIASTGEMSRIALALKSVSGQGNPGAALIFDEIDAGIGADLGDVIAEKLLALAQTHQIVCITHMPQIAATARRHLVVVKESGSRGALVRVETVERNARRLEIERMLGGDTGPGHVSALAEDLLRRGGAFG